MIQRFSKKPAKRRMNNTQKVNLQVQVNLKMKMGN